MLDAAMASDDVEAELESCLDMSCAGCESSKICDLCLLFPVG